MSIDVTTEIVIKKPVADVAGYAASTDNAAEWSTNVRSVTWITERPLQKGALIAFQAKFLGQSPVNTHEIIEFEPNVRLIMRSSDGPFEMETTYIWTATSASTTRMTVRYYAEPAGVLGLLSPFLAFVIKRIMAQDLANLRKLLEGG